MADEPTAIRYPKRGKAHRSRRGTLIYRNEYTATVCDPILDADKRGWTERVPLSQTAPEDRCKTCWPTPKEAGQ